MDTGHLNMMARQIARNLATMGEAEAAIATARHIIEFWEPRMIVALESDTAPDNMAILNEIKRQRLQSQNSI